MGVSIYDKIKYEKFNNIIKLNLVLMKMNIEIEGPSNYNNYETIYMDTIGEDCLDLRYSEWCDFLNKYVWSFFDEQNISFEKFNSDAHGTISRKKMKVLIEYLKTVKVNGIRNQKIKEFLINHENGVTYG